jgi:CRISPR-associated protein Cas1
VLTLARHGTTVVWVGDAAAGVSATVRPLTSSSRLAERQAALWADPVSRRGVARAMFLRRFDGEQVGEDVSLDELRGMEGRRVRELHDWRRAHDGTDPVNVAMNVANAMLYGVAGSVVNALGLSPALGFVHSGNARAFVLDVADLYKAVTSVPTAFACHASGSPADDARRSMREYLSELRRSWRGPQRHHRHPWCRARRRVEPG